MSDKEFIHLIEKYLNGTCSPSERERVEQWYEEHAAGDREFFDSDEEQIRKAAERSLAVVRKRTTVPVLPFDEGRTDARGKIHRNILFIRRLAAAVILLVASGGTYLYLKPKTEMPPLAKAELITKDDVPPGGDNAILTLANGKKIVLNQVQPGVLAEEGNALVSKKNNGELLYQAERPAGLLTEPQFNTLSTPQGGQYQVVLADGTKVWLNALSSLRFPASFSGLTRTVELEGEAYFEVAENKQKPFKVKIPGGAEVRVTGTHFNVMAYENENKISTILLEGGVEMVSRSAVILLKPGQQAILHKKSGMMEKNPADLEEAIAWKNGYFLFNNENIHSIMRKISRWYGVEVTYDGNMEGKDFSGTVSRYKNVSEVLHMLELTGIIHFKVKGRRIAVMP